MGDLQENIAEEIRNRNGQIGEDNIQKLIDGVTAEVEKTTFINRLSSPATIIAAIVGYSVGSQLPDDALIQIAIGILSAATTEHLISSIQGEDGVNKYSEEDIETVYRDVGMIYRYAESTLSRVEQIEKRREASIYKVMMRNPRTRMLIM